MIDSQNGGKKESIQDMIEEDRHLEQNIDKKSARSVEEDIPERDDQTLRGSIKTDRKPEPIQSSPTKVIQANEQANT